MRCRIPATCAAHCSSPPESTVASAELSAAGLLEAAHHLMPTGRGRPRKPRLRRAISTAYYAAFAALTAEVARHYPAGAAQQAVRRLVSHTAARRACADLQRTRSVPWLHGNPPCHPDLLAFATNFESLYILRHLADYDHDYSCTKLEASTALGRAQRAVAALASAREQCSDQLDILCIVTLADDRRRRQISRR